MLFYCINESLTFPQKKKKKKKKKTHISKQVLGAHAGSTNIYQQVSGATATFH
jgi:hypothetical protein